MLLPVLVKAFATPCAIAPFGLLIKSFNCPGLKPATSPISLSAVSPNYLKLLNNFLPDENKSNNSSSPRALNKVSLSSGWVKKFRGLFA